MKKLILSFSLFVGTFILLITSVVAYFSDIKTTNSNEFKLGEVQFTYQGGLKTDLIVPGENIIENPITLVNGSSIDTELRMTITVSSSLFTTQTTLEDLFGYDNENTPYFSLGEGWILEGSHYYYRGLESIENPSSVFRIPPTSQPIVIIDYIELDGFKFTNSHANGTIGIQVIFEAKQADFVTWSYLGTINYNFNLNS